MQRSTLLTVFGGWARAFHAFREVAACRRARAFLEVLLWEEIGARALYDAVTDIQDPTSIPNPCKWCAVTPDSGCGLCSFAGED